MTSGNFISAQQSRLLRGPGEGRTWLVGLNGSLRSTNCFSWKEHWKISSRTPLFLHMRKLGSKRGSDRSRVTPPASCGVWREYRPSWRLLGYLFLYLPGRDHHLGNAPLFLCPCSQVTELSLSQICSSSILGPLLTWLLQSLPD